ncbi:hypothetical protein CAPTEDRAFT_222580 [Capitella teleta]|uniref:Ionotropic glutamate receptor L-glutamate and glycine-binding domain-containing protein n=1 Tax=Capitella teleta TaxID=283909 RepID=R7V582_CAPTE|nr:hypothetical protein CAPTEDRAFT_222580 [Capitella teleta]|eukprot:ELU14028.1 hypothetical protein CAPTEDRAFT_222580 [Capitella teleta]
MALLVLCALVAVVEGRNSSLLPLLTAEKNTCLEEALRGIYDALGFPVVDIICEEMECVQLATSFKSRMFIPYEMTSTCDEDALRRVFKGINQMKDTAIIIVTRKSCIRPILQLQNQSPLLRSVIWSHRRRGIIDLNWPPMNLDALFPAKRFGLNGIQLTVAVKAWPPFVFEHVTNGSARYGGMAIEIMDHIAEALNFTYQTTTPADKLWGNVLPDGSWTGLIGQLQRKEVDMVCAALSANYKRSKVMTFTILPYFVEYMAFLYKKPNPRATLFANFLGPLNTNVWISVISATVLVAVAVRVTGNSEGQHLFEFLFVYFGSLLQRSIAVTPNTDPTRMMFIGWCFFSLALVAAYSANLTASLTSSRFVIPLKTFEDLSVQTEYKMGFIGGGSKLYLFNNSLSPEPYATIGRRIMEEYKNDKTLLSRDSASHIDRAQRGGYVFISDLSYLKTNESCEVTMQTSNEQFKDPLNFGIRKNSALTPLVDRIMMLMLETGLLRRIQNRYYEQRKEAASCDQFTKPGSVKMDVESVTGIMFFLVSSLCGAALVLAIEVICEARKKDLKGGKVN